MWSPVYTQASDPTRKAVIASIQDGGLGDPVYLSAFTSEDSGATWSEVRGFAVYYLGPSDWNGAGTIGVHDTLGGDGFPPYPAVFNNLDNGTPQNAVPGGYLPTATALPLLEGIPVSIAARDGVSDDIYTINAHIDGGTPEQMPTGIDATPIWPNSAPPDPPPPPPPLGDASSAQILELTPLHLFKFNLASFTWTDEGQCGEIVVDPIYGTYTHSSHFGDGFIGSPVIAGISNGRGIAICGTPIDTVVGGPSFPSIVYPNTAPSVDVRMLMNFDAGEGSGHNWDWISDPDDPGNANFLYPYPYRGVDPATGDIYIGGPITGLSGRAARWVAGETDANPSAWVDTEWGEGLVGTVFNSISRLTSGFGPGIDMLKGPNIWDSNNVFSGNTCSVGGNPVLGTDPRWRTAYTSNPVFPDFEYFLQLLNVSGFTMVGTTELVYSDATAEKFGVGALFTSDPQLAGMYLDLVSSGYDGSEFALWYWLGLVVDPPPVLAAACPLNTIIPVGVPYYAEIIVTGGVPPYTYALTAGAFPTGITLDTVTGIISGTTTDPLADYSYTITVTDSNSDTVDITCGITVGCPGMASMLVDGAAADPKLTASGSGGTTLRSLL